MVSLAAASLLALAVLAPGDLVPIDLRAGARIVATHATPADEFKVENAMDGDRATKWVGEGHP